MTGEELLRSPVFLKELHRLFWVEPFDNRGNWDCGWSCRDHALVAACVLRAFETHTQFVHGLQMCVQGAAAGLPPIGLGQAGPGHGEHVWLKSPAGEIIDLSVRLSGTGMGAGWRSLDIDGVVHGEWLPAGIGSVVECSTIADYQKRIAQASHQDGVNVLLYCPLAGADLDRPKIVNAFDFVNSPLTDRLRRRRDTELYAKAVGHIIEVVSGQRRPASGLSQNRAWDIVAQRPAGETEWILRRLGL